VAQFYAQGKLPAGAQSDGHHWRIAKATSGSLKLTGGNQRKAASILGIKPTTLFEKLKKYQIQEKDISLNDKDWQRFFYSSL